MGSNGYDIRPQSHAYRLALNDDLVYEGANAVPDLDVVLLSRQTQELRGCPSDESI